MTDRSLSRRKLLWAATTIGAAASTGSGAAALLSDSEQVESEMAAGTLDLTAQWGNTDSVEQAHIKTGKSGNTDGEKRVVLAVNGNPAYVWVGIPCKEKTKKKKKKKRGNGWSKDWGSWKGKYGKNRHGDGKNGKGKNWNGHDGTDDSDSFLNDDSPDSDGYDDVLVRIGLDDGDSVQWLTGDEGSAFVSPSDVYDQFAGGVSLGQLDPGSANAWEFVIDWKADGVLMKSTKIDFDFTFYATQSRHVEPEMAKPDWDCDKTTGSGISWVAFCASDAFDKDEIELSLSDDELTLSLSGVPDVVDTVTIKHGTNLTVVTYTGQDSITVGNGEYSQVRSGFSGTNRSNPDPCPESDTYGCKYEFPDGWQGCSWGPIDDTEEHEDGWDRDDSDWDKDEGGDGEHHGGWGGWGGDH